MKNLIKIFAGVAAIAVPMMAILAAQAMDANDPYAQQAAVADEQNAEEVTGSVESSDESEEAIDENAMNQKDPTNLQAD